MAATSFVTPARVTPQPGHNLEPTTSGPSSCGNLHKAILTGSEGDIVAGMNAVLADRRVHDTSRKVAKYHTGRDQDNLSEKRRDILIIRDSCIL